VDESYFNENDQGLPDLAPTKPAAIKPAASSVKHPSTVARVVFARRLKPLSKNT
jgi:hypothetical protein